MVKEALGRRLLELERGLAPALGAEIGREVAVLFGTMAIPSGDVADLRATIRLYEADLAGLPIWAVREACGAFRRGDIGKPPFAPRIAELRQEVISRIQRFESERQVIKATLAARIEAPAVSKDEAKARFAEILKGLAGALAPADGEGAIG